MKRIPDAAILGRLQPTTGIDFLEEPIQRAKRKAVERGVPATFLVKDALTLKDWSEWFDTVIDSRLFHVFDDENRRTGHLSRRPRSPE